MSLLEACAISHIHAGGGKALDAFSLTINKGERLALLGPNGSGKTTALLHLNGTFRPQAGFVALDGKVQGYRRHELLEWRKRVGLVLQDADDQLFAATVAEDVSFGPLNLGLSVPEVRLRVSEALIALGIADLAERPTHMLSYGQKKRVAIAGVIAMRPEILLLDEPAAGLDRRGEELLLAALALLQQNGATLVFTTHDADLAYDFADRVALLEKGTVVAEGETTAVLTDHALLERLGIGVPLLVDFGLAAQQLGLLAPSSSLPRRRHEVLALFTRPKSA